MVITDEMLRDSAEPAAAIYLEDLEKQVADVPEHIFSARFERRMRRLIRAQRRTPRMNAFIGAMQKAAGFFAVLMLGLGIVTVSVEAYRDQFIRFVKKVTRRSTTYEYRIGNVPYLKADLRKSVIGYVPEGFSIAKQSLYEDYCYINYADTIGHDYSIELTFVDSSTSGFVSIDTEGSELKYIMINDFEAVLNAKDDERQLLWSVNNVICQLAGNIDEDEMIHIAEEITILFEQE